MKYLRTYKDINESKGFNEEDIKNCFTDLSDFGFTISVHMSMLLQYGYVSVIINYGRTHLEEYFDFSKVKETLLFAIPYMVSEYNLEFSNLNMLTANQKPSAWLELDNIDAIIEFDDDVKRIIMRFKHQEIKSKPGYYQTVNGLMPKRMKDIKDINESSDDAPIGSFSQEDVKNIFESHIDWDFLADVKEAAVDHFDNGLGLCISVLYDGIGIFNLLASHHLGVSEKWIGCDRVYSMLMDKSLGNYRSNRILDLIDYHENVNDYLFKYSISIGGGEFKLTRVYSKELVDLMRSMYPNIKILD